MLLEPSLSAPGPAAPGLGSPPGVLCGFSAGHFPLIHIIVRLYPERLSWQVVPCPVVMMGAPSRSSQPKDSPQVCRRLEAGREKDYKEQKTKRSKAKPTKERENTVFWKDSCTGFRVIRSRSDSSD